MDENIADDWFMLHVLQACTDSDIKHWTFCKLTSDTQASTDGFTSCVSDCPNVMHEALDRQ